MPAVHKFVGQWQHRAILVAQLPARFCFVWECVVKQHGEMVEPWIDSQGFSIGLGRLLDRAVPLGLNCGS